MSDEAKTAVGPQQLLVLYADIAGSTRLYEEFGDVMARDATAACLDTLCAVAAKFGGRLVKTIGDEVMVAFRDPAKGAMAATDMQGAVRKASDEGRYVTGTLRVKVGMHFGSGIEETDDVFGEASNVAQQVIKLAKADQVLTTRATIDALPPVLRMGCRFFDKVPAEGASRQIDVYELIWEVSGLTQVADIGPPAARVSHTILHVEFRDQIFIVDADRPVLTIGRVAGNDVLVPTDLTSRSHAEIELKRGRFQITDNSSNGTLVVNDGGGVASLRREHTLLSGSGRICLGGSAEDNPAGVLRFRCE